MEKLTVYIPRFISDEQSYLMFMECLDNAVKYLKGFDVLFIVLCDNENKITMLYDPQIMMEYNIKFVKNEFKYIPDLAGYYYHYKYHPSEYMLQLFANVMLSRDIDYDDVITSVNEYGCYSLCYNYCFGNIFTQIYNWMRILFPELNFYSDYLSVKEYDHDHVSAQANQMFTTYTNICKVKEKFSVTFNKLFNYDKLSFSMIPDESKHLFNEKDFNRQIRTVTEHFFTQLFFKTFNTPVDKIYPLSKSSSCMYGITFVNLWAFGYILTGNNKLYPTEEHFNKYLISKNNSDLHKIFCKFCTGKIVN